LRNRLLYALLIAGMAAAGFILPAAGHGREPRPVIEARVTLDREELAGFAGGTLTQYEGTTWVQVRLRGDLGETESEANEWTLETHSDPDCSSLVEVLTFTSPPAYGPRVYERVAYPIGAIGSIQLVHEGPLSDHGQTSPGHHHLACSTTGGT